MKKIVLCSLLALMFISGCNSGLPAVSVSLSPSAAQAIDIGQSVAGTATVTNDSASKGVTWSLSSASFGTLSSPASTTTTTFTATAAGSETLTATSIADATKTATLTITVTALPAITTTSLPAGTEGTAYSQTIAASGGAGAKTFSLVTGALPAGLALNAATGAITGTPTAWSGTAVSFTVKVTDASTAGAQPSAPAALSITINPPPAPVISTTSLPGGTEGTAYSQTVSATGYRTFVYSISVGALPAGLTLNSTTGAITGTPTGPNGTSNFAVKVTDGSNPTQSVTQALSIAIALPPAPGITPASLSGGSLGTPYNQSVSVTGGLGPYTWGISGTQIAGVTFTGGTTSATLAGIPTTAATYNFTVTVTDSSNPTQSASQAYTVVIGAMQPLAITTASLPGGVYNTAYGPVTINATGGIAPYSFGATGLPTGMTLSSGGSLSGTPTTAGVFSVAITVTDSISATASATLSLTITASALVLTPGTGSLPSATQSAAYTTSLTPSGGVGPYSIALDASSAALPSGLTFNSTTAVTTAATITGTPSATGTTTGIIVAVTDSESPTVTTKFTYSLTVVLPCGSGHESLLSGQYAFALRGFDGSGNVALIGGVLTADGAGNLTAGAVDMNLSGGVQSNLAIASGSTYTVGSDGRGYMAMSISGPIAVITQNYRFSLGASGNGHMIDFDTAGPFTTGVLRKQTLAAFSTAQISGKYAFGVASPLDSAQGGGKFAAEGVLNLSAGSVTGGSMDYNLYNANTATVTLDGVSGATAWPASPVSIGSSGTYTVNGTTGRGTLSFTPSGSSAVNAYIYVVSSGEVLSISSDARTVNNLFAGAALLQSSTSYSTSSLSGKTVVYDSNNNGGGGGSSIDIGIVTITGTNNFSYAGYSNGGGTIQTPTNNSASGTFSVASNGRVTLTITSGGGNQSPEFYLFSPSSGFAVFSGNNAGSGLMESQTSTSVSGTYAAGTIAPQTAGESDKESIVTFSSGTASATTDGNSQGSLSPNNTASTSYSVDATGVVFIPASCTPGTNCEKIGTVVTPSKIILMGAKASSGGGTTSPNMEVADK